MGWRSTAVVAAAVAASSLVSPRRVSADLVVATWNNTTGNWSNLSKWTGTSAIPNNAGGTTYEAGIHAGKVTLDQNVTIQNLTLSKEWYTPANGPELASTNTLGVNGSMYWDTGSLTGTGTINANGTMTIDPATWIIYNYQTINNYGTAAWRGSNSYALLNGGTINNMAGATFDAQADSTISNYGGVFNNYGLLVKSQATDYNMYSYIANANNYGTVQVNAGTLYLSSGTGTGTFSAAPNCLLYLDQTYTLTPTSVLSGAGIISLANVTVQGQDNVTGTTRITGTTQFAAGARISGVGGINVYNNAHAIFNTGAPVVVNGASMLAGSFGNGRIEGADDLTFTNLDWKGGTFATTNVVHLSGQTALTGFNAATVDHTTVQNSGTVTASIGVSLPGSTFVNLPGASFQVNVPTGSQNSVVISDATAPDRGTFNNAGTFTVVSGTQAGPSIGATFNNTGTVDVQSAGIGFMGGITNSGIIRGAQYTTIAFGSSSDSRLAGLTHNLPAGSQLVTDGSVAFGSGTANIAGRYHSSGWTSVDGGATVNFLPGATIETDGGRLIVSSKGIVNFNSGSLVTFGDMNVNGTVAGSDSLCITGTLNGSGTVNNPIVVNGTLSPGNSPGIFTSTSSLSLLSGSHSLFEIGGRTRTSTSTDYDFVKADGQISLDGTLGLTFCQWIGSPITSADTFPLIISSAPLTGSFDNVTNGQRLMTQDGLGSFAVYYGPNSPYGANELAIGNYLAGPIPEPSVLAVVVVSSLMLRRRRPTEA